MLTIRKTILSLTVLLFASVPLALGQGTYTQIDYPGAANTWVTCIDAAGEIAGHYQYLDGHHSFGFLLSGGTYTRIVYPGAQYTYVLGMNNLGQIVGFATNDPYGIVRGFVYDFQTQAFTDINVLGSTNIYPYAINDAGTIVGFFPLSSPEYGKSFEKTSSGQGRLIALAGAQSTWVFGISESDEVVGYVTNNVTNFAIINGKVEELRIPARAAEVTGISPAGTALVGGYALSSWVALGFVYQNGALTTLRWQKTSTTIADGINDAGEVVGYFAGVHDNMHGFLWTPPAAAAAKK